MLFHQFAVNQRTFVAEGFFLAAAITAACATLAVSAANAQVAFPACSSAQADSDGDGWGWENNQSCQVQRNAPASANTSNGFPLCSSSASDLDGDGWGWESNRSCVVSNDNSSNKQTQSSPTTQQFATCSSSSSDYDGDGYGWENGQTCLVSSAKTPEASVDAGIGNTVSSGAGVDFQVCRSAASDPDGDGYGWENNATCVVGSESKTSTPEIRIVEQATGGSFSISDVTDVVLVTGQSNVLATGTSFNAGLDQPNDRVFAYTNQGWQVANLNQQWDRFQHPDNFSSQVPGKDPNNSFAFHFGKTLASRRPSRVVAFIVVPAPGEGISTWDRGSAVYRLINEKVTSALAKIPHKHEVDGVLWHQGENDYLYEGTADEDPTGFSSLSSHEYINYYQVKLDALIANFRSEPWGRFNTAFICGETRRGLGVNRRLNALNNDKDQYTACVPATDLPKRADDPVGSHFSAAGLRTLGQRYADAYLGMNIR